MGIVNSIFTDQQFMKLLIWDENEHIPSKPTWHNHMTPRLIDMEHFSNFCWLNQICGIRPKLWIEHDETSINPLDGAFDKSFIGPDVLSIPHGTHKLPFSKIKMIKQPLYDSHNPSYMTIPCINSLSLTLDHCSPTQKIKFKNSQLSVPPFFKDPVYSTTNDAPMMIYAVRDGANQNKNKYHNCFYIPFLSNFGKDTQQFAIF